MYKLKCNTWTIQNALWTLSQFWKLDIEVKSDITHGWYRFWSIFLWLDVSSWVAFYLTYNVKYIQSIELCQTKMFLIIFYMYLVMFLYTCIHYLEKLLLEFCNSSKQRSDMECAPDVHHCIHHARQRLAWLPPGIYQCSPGAHSMSECCLREIIPYLGVLYFEDQKNPPPANGFHIIFIMIMD